MQRQTKYKIGRINIWLIIALTCAGLMTSLSLDVPDAAATYSQRPADTTQDLPDLIFESVTLDPPNPQIGDTVKVHAVVKNQSDVFAGGFTIYLYWNPTDQPPTADTKPTAELGYNLGLAPGVSFEWRRDVDVTSSDLTYYVWIDRDNEVYESNEENNLYRYPSLSPTPVPTEEYPPTPEPTIEPTPIPTYEPTVEPTPQLQYQPDEYEEDDACGDATEIATNGTAQQHNLFLTDSDVDGDHDWVRFEAISGEEYHIVASPNGDAGSDAEMNLSVIDDCEEDSGGAFGGNEAEFIFTANKNGTHYIEIYHNDNDYGPKTDYTLTVIAQDSCEDFYEPNNSCPRSNDLFVDKEAQPHRFCQIGDVDWMHFEGEAGLEYKVSFEERGDVDGVQIEIHGTCNIQEPSALGETESLQFYANSDGPIYLRLSNRDSNRYGPDTEYAVQVQQVGESACGPDEHEQDDEFSTAKAINIAGGNFSQTHNTCPANEADWTQFQAEKDKTYLIETTDLGQSANPTSCIYDSTGTLIECDSNSGLGNGTKLIWKATEDGNYYVEIKDEDSTVAGPDTAYTLRISTDLCGGALHESNDDPSQATSIQIDNPQLHTFCQEADEDWVKFETSTGNYVITADPGENGADTVLALYDPSGMKVAENNDTGDGFGARIEYQVSSAGTYHVLAHAHDPNSYGSEVEYNIRVQYEPPPTATPVPTAEPTPTPTPTSTPPPSDTRTLILVNRDRLVQLHGESDTVQIEAKLEALKNHDRVRGEIIQLQKISAVSNAYDAWLSNLNDVQNANQVADAIKRALLNHLDQKGGIEYIVLVGDDRALPFRRVKDPTASVRRDFTERQYSGYGENHPTYAALSQDYILTDDFYIDREMEDFYVPDMDLSIGRLIESPSQIIMTIDEFLDNPDTKVERALVTGYDFLVDSGESMCKRWQDDVDASGNVNCEMMSQNWSGDRLRQAQRDEVYQIQSINGHALHNLEGAPDQNNVSGNDIASGTSAIGGSLLYTLGCHGGLNVPGMMDLPESFISRGGTYIGNTGYGWGYRGGIGLSEQLMELLTFNLTEGVQATIGTALVVSKHQYVLDQSSINAYDEKILQQVILYGLPMRRILTSASFSSTPLSERDALFTMDHTSVRASAAQNDVETIGIDVVRQSEFNDNATNTSDGMIYSLDGQTITDPGQAIMPANYSQDINLKTDASMPDARSLVLMSGKYTTQQDFDPVIATAHNEYTENSPSEEAADLTVGWSPASPMMLSRQGGSAQVISSLGQYDTATQQLRLFDELRGRLYLSDSPDTRAPQIMLVSGIYDAEVGKTTVKVGVEDESGVMSVFVSWFDEESNGSGKIVTQPLTNESGMAGWSTSANHNMAKGFFIQAVDNAGNSSIDYNNGHYYLPSSGGIVAPLSIQVNGTSDPDDPDDSENSENSEEPEAPKAPDGLKVYLPVVVR